MPICKRIKRKHRKVCIGDLDDIDIQKRTLSDSLDNEEQEGFVNILTPWALVETLKGVFVVDGVNGGDIEATHSFIIELPEIVISSENWINFNGKRFRILDQQNLEERNEWLQLLCTDKGLDTKDAASA